MNNFFLISFIYTSLIFSQNDIKIKQFNIYKNKYDSSIDMRDYIQYFNGNYLVKLISFDNFSVERKKKIIIEICNLEFSLDAFNSNIDVKNCDNELSINGEIYLDDQSSIINFNSPKFKFIEGELIFWVYGNFENISKEKFDDGLLKEYYDNGNNKIEYNYSNGKKNGVQKKWYSNGQLLIKYNYDNGKLDGLQKKWYENGQLQSESNYYRDVLNGVSKYWYSNGQLKFVKVYENGILIETLETYDINGISQ